MDRSPTPPSGKKGEGKPGDPSKRDKKSHPKKDPEAKTDDKDKPKRERLHKSRKKSDKEKDAKDKVLEEIPHVPFIEFSELEVKQEIGKGNFGVVYLGKCRGMEVAIKKLYNSAPLEAAALDAFKKEVAMMVILHHPAIVLFLGACPIPGNLAIVTEYLPRGDLQKLLKEKSPLSFIQQCIIGLDVASGVQWLHGMKVIHRDLKPCNILITNDLHAKIADFGLSITQETLNNGQCPRGTPLWMAPEVLLPSICEKPASLNEKIDIYSYGLILWQLFTRSEPYESHTNPMRFIEAVCLHEERPQLPHKKITIPKLAQLIEVCWGQNPQKRPAMGEVEKVLREVMVEGTILCPDAAQMWKTHWPGKLTVPFHVFAEVLFSTLGEDRNVVSTAYRCLHRILAEKQESSTTEITTLQRFGLVVSWIGPFRGGFSPWLSRLIDIMGMPWFHGDIDRQAAEQLLKNHGQKNCWLIRFSLTAPVWSSPFTVSKFVKKSQGQKNIIVHQRVYFSDTGYYFYVGPEGQHQEKISRDGDFSKLRPELLRHGLKGKRGLKNGPYSDLFSDMGSEFLCMYLPTPDLEGSSSSH